MTSTVRPKTPAVYQAVFEVHRRAFGQEAGAVLVDALRAGGYAEVSLVAEAAGRAVGHVSFSRLPFRTAAGTVDAVSLAPVAILPDRLRHCVGSGLVRAGLEACRACGHGIAVVLGHPSGRSSEQRSPGSRPGGE